MSKWKWFGYGALSGIVEPIGAIITILLTNAVVPILPYLLSFAAGAMIYVVVEELIPESQAGEHSNIGTIGVAIGFVVMMILREIVDNSLLNMNGIRKLCINESRFSWLVMFD